MKCVLSDKLTACGVFVIGGVALASLSCSSSSVFGSGSQGAQSAAIPDAVYAPLSPSVPVNSVPVVEVTK